MLFKNPQNPACCTIDVAFTSSARTAWRLILQEHTALHQRPLRLLLPAYIGQTDREGSGVFDPVRQTASQVTFYGVSAKLTPDLLSIQNSIVDGDIDVLLVIHYFGFVQADLLALKALCRQHGVIFVEDCAHCCFLPSAHPGSIGDYSFFSLHKFFPTATGGVLRNNPGQRSINRLPALDAGDRCKTEVLEQVMKTDLEAVSRKRRENYEFLEQALASVPDIEPMMKLGPQTIPHDFPVVVTKNRREKLYFYLAERDLITTALYYRLVDEISEAEYPISFDLANNILNLPVHQDTDVSDLELLVTEIEKFFESESAHATDQ